MTEKDWTLLVIAAAGGKAVSPVQLQKTLFLLSRKLTPEDLRVSNLYNFTPYDYGPFDSAIYADAESLERTGQVVIENAERRYRSYRATAAGAKEATELRRGLEQRTTKYLDRLVDWVTALSFNELIEAVYKSFPEMAANSVFRRQSSS